MYIPGSDVQIRLSGDMIEVLNAGKVARFDYRGLPERKITDKILDVTYRWGLKVMRMNIDITVRHLGITFSENAGELGAALDILKDIVDRDETDEQASDVAGPR